MDCEIIAVELHGDYGVVITDRGKYRYCYEMAGFDLDEEGYLDLVVEDFRLWRDDKIDTDVFEEVED